MATIPLPGSENQDIYDLGFSKGLNRAASESRNPLVYNNIADATQSPIVRFGELRGPVNNSSVIFGGTSSDGALSLTGSASSSIDLGSNATVVKNYSSLLIQDTATLTFTNPHANGTLIIFKVRGNVTITSTATRAIDLRSLGGIGGASVTTNGVAGNVGNTGRSNISKSNAGAGGGASGAADGLGGSGGIASYISTNIDSKVAAIACGAGGGSGGSGSVSSSGAGGRGAGALYIECGGLLTISGTIDAGGAVGAAGTNTTGIGNSASGGGGGGGGGTIAVIYNTLSSNTGTYTVTGGAGGAGGTWADSAPGKAGGGGGGGGGATADGAVGAAGGSPGGYGGAGGAGGAGGSYVVLNTAF